LEIDLPTPDFVEIEAGNSSRPDAKSGCISKFDSGDDAEFGL
jgi:hypothetical protein